MGHHDDQTVLGDLFEKLHHLEAGLRIQRAGGLVRQEDFRVIDQGPGDGDALHLPAAHLVRLLACLVPEADLFQGFQRALLPFLPVDAGQGQRQLHIGQHRLMRDQVIALKDKADPVIAVVVPVPVFIFLGGAAVDQQVPAVGVIQTADDVQQRRLSAAGRTQNGDKLVFTQGHVDAAESFHCDSAGLILFGQFPQLEHRCSSNWSVFQAFYAL